MVLLFLAELGHKRFVPQAVVCTENLDSDVMVVESAEERMGANASDPLNWARDRRALRSRRG